MLLPETLFKIIENRMVGVYNHTQMFLGLGCALLKPGYAPEMLGDYARQLVKLQGGEGTVYTLDFWIKYLDRLHNQINILRLTAKLQSNPTTPKDWIHRHNLVRMAEEFAEDREAMFWLAFHAVNQA
jgi:hypothetical protein